MTDRVLSATRSTLLAALVAGLSHTAAAQTPIADVQKNVSIISGMAGVCLDVEGGRTANGTRVIGYPCSGQYNQQFFYTRAGHLTHANKCVVVEGGQGRSGDHLVLWDCNGGANEQWSLRDGKLLGQNGLCMDLEGGDWQRSGSPTRFFSNQPAILFRCNGQRNQQWRWALVVPQANLINAQMIRPGTVATFEPIVNVVSAQTTRVVAPGGANVVAAGGGNVVAPGGAN